MPPDPAARRETGQAQQNRRRWRLWRVYISRPSLVSLLNDVPAILSATSRRPPPRLIFQRDDAMLALVKHAEPAELGDILRNARAATADLVGKVIGQGCRRFSSIGHGAKTARLERVIAANAWTEAALALIDLELPQWQIRRIAYDGGEWYCALSRERELPDWLDRSVEGRHADLALAILAAFVEAQDLAVRSGRPSVPSVPRDVDPLHAPVCCDNFA
jgi:hypothetical protein